MPPISLDGVSALSLLARIFSDFFDRQDTNGPGEITKAVTGILLVSGLRLQLTTARKRTLLCPPSAHSDLIWVGTVESYATVCSAELLFLSRPHVCTSLLSMPKGLFTS